MELMPLFAEMGALHRGTLTLILVGIIVGLSFGEVTRYFTKRRKDEDERTNQSRGTRY